MGWHTLDEYIFESTPEDSNDLIDVTKLVIGYRNSDGSLIESNKLKVNSMFDEVNSLSIKEDDSLGERIGGLLRYYEIDFKYTDEGMVSAISRILHACEGLKNAIYKAE